jgi:hypothetical protein
MTKNSPRIYIYKITFEEVPYYYYGVHKEKKFDEYYMGTPVTHKWAWDFYTPKKQILQFFELSDEGYLEAQEVEKRLIRPFYNTDKWCLNESCGGMVSVQISRKVGKLLGSKYGKINGSIVGKRMKEEKKGIFAMTNDEKSELGKRNGQKNKENKKGICGLTPEQRKEIAIMGGKVGGKIVGTMCKELGIGIFSLLPEERSENGKKSGNKHKENKTGICGLSKKEKSIAGKLGGKRSAELKVGCHKISPDERRRIASKTNSQKWKCLETGYISNPAGLSSYQKARGIDTSLRERLE